MKLLLIAWSLAACLSTPAGAYVYCSEPSAPSCADDFTSFVDEYDFNSCRDDMEDYRRDVSYYLDCLSTEADETIAEYNRAVEDFNDRASY
jgi:hypothetical protein